MNSSQDLSSQEKENLAGEVMESLGTEEAAEQVANSNENAAGMDANQDDDLPLYAKEKLGKMQKRYQRDMRRLQEQVNMLQSQRLMGSQNDSLPAQSVDQYVNAPPASNGGSIEEAVQRAVSGVLKQKEMQEQRAKEAEQQAYLAKQYQNMQKDIDRTSDKYDDFHDVVLADDVPITPHMRDAALLIDNPGEVLYKLGKNRAELERIGKLHPLDQAREVNKLSAALLNGEQKIPQAPRTLGQVKSNPIISQAVTEKTSPAEIRALIRAGKFK